MSHLSRPTLYWYTSAWSACSLPTQMLNTARQNRMRYNDTIGDEGQNNLSAKSEDNTATTQTHTHARRHVATLLSAAASPRVPSSTVVLLLNAVRNVHLCIQGRSHGTRHRLPRGEPLDSSYRHATTRRMAAQAIVPGTFASSQASAYLRRPRHEGSWKCWSHRLQKCIVNSKQTNLGIRSLFVLFRCAYLFSGGAVFE